jgi:hypothetical protein
MFIGQVFNPGSKIERSEIRFSTPKEAKIWCGNRTQFGDSIWVIIDIDAGVVHSGGIADHMFEDDNYE